VKKVAFRTSIGGFNKKDVTQFVISQNIENEKKLKEKDEIILSLEEQISNIENNRIKFHEEIKRQNDANKNNKSIQVKLNDDILHIISLIDSLNEDVKKAVTLCDEFKIKLTEFNEKLSVALKFQDKAEKFDKFTNLLTSMLNNDEINHQNDTDVIKINHIYENFEECDSLKLFLMSFETSLKELSEKTQSFKEYSGELDFQIHIEE